MISVFTLAVIVCCALNHVTHVNSAVIRDVTHILHTSLRKNWRFAFNHPTVESLLNFPSDVKLDVVSTDVTAHGVRRARFKELYKGFEVIDASVEANVDDAGRYDTGPVTGTVVFDLQQDLPESCTLTHDEARDIIFTGESFSADTETISMEVKTKVYLVGTQGHLVYAVDLLVILSSRAEARPYYIIDCSDGTVLQHFQQFTTQSTYETVQWDITGSTESWQSPNTVPVSPITTPPTTQPPQTQAPQTQPPQTQAPSGSCAVNVNVVGGNEKFGVINYGTPPYCLELKQINGNCILENQYIKVVDALNTEDTTKTNPIEFVCANGYSKPANGAYNPGIDALFYGTAAFKVFKEWYNTNPLERPPTSKTRIVVHFGTNHENAFWDGEIMAFGDGASDFYPLVSLNVIAHELSHGVTEKNSNLAYEKESGGINEAFSDMAGEVTELYVRGRVDWKVGFNIIKSPTEALRYMDDPTLDQRSVSHISNYNDEMDVHHSSGIYNNVFYRVVTEGKVPLRDAFQGFLNANKRYWGQNTGFRAGSCGVIRGANDAGLDMQKFIDAFSQVGITQDCKINSFMEPLKASKPRTNVRVSSITQPMFSITTLDNTRGYTVTATTGSGKDVKLVLMKSIARSPAQKKGIGSVEESQAVPKSLYYVRAYTESPGEINDVTLTLTFETTA